MEKLKLLKLLLIQNQKRSDTDLYVSDIFNAKNLLVVNLKQYARN